MDDSKSLHEKWLFHKTSIKQRLFGLPGIYIYVYIPKDPWKWYIYQHFVDFYGTCRSIYHTWILWECIIIHTLFIYKPLYICACICCYDNRGIFVCIQCLCLSICASSFTSTLQMTCIWYYLIVFTFIHSYIHTCIDIYIYIRNIWTIRHP